MAAIITNTLTGKYSENAASYLGDGVIADTDELATNVVKYPIGTKYIDKTGHKEYTRLAVVGVAADFKSVLLK